MEIADGGGTFTRTIGDGPANGVGFLLASPGPVQVPEALYMALGAPLFLGLNPAAALVAEGPFLLDADGTHVSQLPAPPAGVIGQAVLFHPDLTLAGSTNVVP